MKIVMTNMTTGTKRVVTFNEVCNNYYCGQYNSNGGRRSINYKLLSGEVIKYNDIDGDYEIRREINKKEVN